MNIICLGVSDLDASIAFYGKDGFGLAECNNNNNNNPESKTSAWFQLNSSTWLQLTVMETRQRSKLGHVCSSVADMRELARRVSDMGATVMEETQTRFVLTDLDGHGWEVVLSNDELLSWLWTSKEQAEKKKRVLVYVTGFDRFQGVETNPTKELVLQLQRDHHQSIPSCKASLVLETSGKGSVEMLEAFLAEHKVGITGDDIADDCSVVLLHLGVHSGAQSFHIEQCAYNEADFRVPDEQGWQPRKALIATTGVDHKCTTSIDVAALCKNLNATMDACGSACRSVVSTDPGRFVCNWIYFQSLLRTTAEDAHSLFVHVPPFSVYSQKEQFAYLAALVNAIVAQAGTR